MKLNPAELQAREKRIARLWAIIKMNRLTLKSVCDHAGHGHRTIIEQLRRARISEDRLAGLYRAAVELATKKKPGALSPRR